MASIMTSPKGSGQSIGKSNPAARPRNSVLAVSLISPTNSVSVPSTSGAITSRKKPSASRTIDRYTRSLLEHRASSTQHDLEWIDELIAQERAEQLDRPEGATA
jgi:hypothetical protein